MYKRIYFLFALITVSNAVVRQVTITSGHIEQGKYATGLTIRKNINCQYEIEWTEKFDNDNSLTVYLAHIYEDTGLVERIKLDNLCVTNPRTSYLKHFILRVFRGTNDCPIEKGNTTILFPDTFEISSASKNCGPIIGTIHIVRNKNPGSDKTPLLFNAQLRSVISGADC